MRKQLHEDPLALAKYQSLTSHGGQSVLDAVRFVRDKGFVVSPDVLVTTNLDKWRKLETAAENEGDEVMARSRRGAASLFRLNQENEILAEHEAVSMAKEIHEAHVAEEAGAPHDPTAGLDLVQKKAGLLRGEAGFTAAAFARLAAIDPGAAASFRTAYPEVHAAVSARENAKRAAEEKLAADAQAEDQRLGSVASKIEKKYRGDRATALEALRKQFGGEAPATPAYVNAVREIDDRLLAERKAARTEAGLPTGNAEALASAASLQKIGAARAVRSVGKPASAPVPSGKLSEWESLQKTNPIAAASFYLEHRHEIKDEEAGRQARRDAGMSNDVEAGFAKGEVTR